MAGPWVYPCWNVLVSMVMNFNTVVLRCRSGRLSAAAAQTFCRDFVFSLESICFSVPGSRLAVPPGLSLPGVQPGWRGIYGRSRYCYHVGPSWDGMSKRSIKNRKEKKCFGEDISNK